MRSPIPLLLEKKGYGELISPHRDRNNPIYNWHSFKHSFSRDLVKKLIDDFNLERGSWVMDNFSGGGTTLLACKERGINSRGFDILPFAVFLSNTKTRSYKEKRLKSTLKSFKNSVPNGNNNLTLPSIPLIEKAFTPKVSKKLLSIKEKINRIHDPTTQDFFMLGLLSILESVSNTSKSGGFLRIVERDISPKEVYPKFLEKIKSMIDDVRTFNESLGYKDARTRAILSDSRYLPTKRKFDAIITSPPYPNRHDYTRIYALELILNFVNSNDELKKIRYETLRSHVEARGKYPKNGYKEPRIIDDLISEIKSNGTNNPQVSDMLRGYFEDMYLSLKEMKRCLKPKGKIGLVVSNVRFSGVNIPVDEILADAGEQARLKTKEIIVARYRGNSSQQMKKYKRKPSRESIVVWEN